MENIYDKTARAKKTPEEENRQAVAIIGRTQNLTQLTDELESLRRLVAVEAKRKDIDYVLKMDRVIDTILTAITDNEAVLYSAILGLLKAGKMRDLKDLMIAFGITVDKREGMLGFDETRNMRKRKFNLKVAFKGSDGSQTGISIESD